MSLPEMTPLLRRLHTLAKRHHLPNALGRAIVLVNRHYNTGKVELDWRYVSSELIFMKKVSAARALRWLLHWTNGGSLKCLSRTREEERRRRKKF